MRFVDLILVSKPDTEGALDADGYPIPDETSTEVYAEMGEVKRLGELRGAARGHPAFLRVPRARAGLRRSDHRGAGTTERCKGRAGVRARMGSGWS